MATRLSEKDFNGPDPAEIIALLRRLGWDWDVTERPGENDIAVTLYFGRRDDPKAGSSHWATPKGASLDVAFARLRQLVAQHIDPKLARVASQAAHYVDARVVLDEVNAEPMPQGDPQLAFHNKRARAITTERRTADELRYALEKLA